MSVLGCVGCLLAASTLQSRVEFYRCCGNARLLSTEKKNIFTPTVSNFHSCCWTWSYSTYLPPRRWQKTPSGSQGCLCVIGAMKDMTDNHTHTSPGNASKNTRGCTVWCILGYTMAAMSHCGKLGTCSVKCVVVSWCFDNQTIRSRLGQWHFIFRWLVCCAFHLFFFLRLNSEKHI